jgi:multiple sugar transport system permease protein
MKVMNIATEASVYTAEAKSRKKKSIGKIFKYLAVIFVSISMVLPFVWMLSASLKAETEIFGFPIKWIPETFRVKDRGYYYYFSHYQ